MSLDFATIKEIKMTDVVARYQLVLRFKGEYAATCCPLPSHKQGDTSKSFSINLGKNYWRCFSASCNEAAGCKGGDCINFVALMENWSQLDAAKKLAEWFGVGQKQTPQHMAEASKTEPKTEMQSSNKNDTASPATVKYMADVDAWFTELFKRQEKETDVDYWKRTRNGVKSRLVLSFRNGKRVAAGLQPE